MIEVKKTNESVSYEITDGEFLIGVDIENNNTITISNHRGDVKFMFTDSKPEVVAAIGRMLIAASELVKER